jgi:hypothetical protein
MPTPDIALTPDESSLFEKIALNWEGLDHNAFMRNGELVATLMKSLVKRKAIPVQRMKWFTDPGYRTGRMKGSRRDLFHRNGNTDEEMLRHASFLSYLRYFVCGPDLPPAAIAEFRDAVRRCGQITSGDVETLRKFARQQTRQRGLLPHEACEEYFKLALDCGVWVSYAFFIRDAVKDIH